MTKRSIYIILFVLIPVVAVAQQNQSTTETEKIVTLKKQLALAKDDSSRIHLMSTIGFIYEVLNADSAIKYAEDGLALAKKSGNTSAESGLLLNLASVMRQQGKIAESLDLLFKSLALAEKNNKTDEVGRVYRRLADVYYDLDNFPKAIAYLLQALKIDEDNKHAIGAAIDHVTLGDAYEKINKLDSASLHTNIAFENKELLKPWIEYLYQALGNIQFKKGSYAQAIPLLEKGFSSAQNNSDFKTASSIGCDIATVFIQVNQKDSAIYFALKGFEFGQQTLFKKGIIRSGNLLAKLYDSIQPVTALKYLKIATGVKDSLFGIDNIQTIQNLVTREENRQKELETAQESFKNRLRLYGLFAGIAVLLIIALILLRNNRQKQKANVTLINQKEKIEATLTELKSTQAQLIQSEKMASLGELTAGIAHEIQNPLNFVNNFSEVSNELIDEMKEELSKGNYEDANTIADDIKQNLEKINHHGKRADGIVKGMLQHSRSSSATKEPTDINKLADEYLRLAYHGLRAKDKSFNATLQTDFDASVGKVNIIPQDIGRVILNLITNAFYSVQQKQQQATTQTYEPTVSVSTKKLSNKISITVKDNGNGIPKNIVDKILQPFFTTKPTGQGTGLGLSLSYDIIKAHGGELTIETKEGEFAAFVITLPI